MVNLGGVAACLLGVCCRLCLSAGARAHSGAVSVGCDGLGSCCRTDYGGGRSFVVVIGINFRLGPAGSCGEARDTETEHDDRNAGNLPCVHVLFTLGTRFDAGLIRNLPAHYF